MKRIILRLLLVCAAAAASANGGIPWESIEPGAARITLKNDRNLLLEKEDLTISLEEDAAVVTCEYVLTNTLREAKDVDFAFSIPIATAVGITDVFLEYGIRDGGRSIPFERREEVDNESDPWESQYRVWELSRLHFAPQEKKRLSITYTVRTGTWARICAAYYDTNSFSYNLFPAASFGDGKIKEFTLTIVTEKIFPYGGHIVSVSGMDLAVDKNLVVQKYSFTDFDVSENREIRIEYDINGYYIAQYVGAFDEYGRTFKSVTATSELQEGRTLYAAKNLADRDYATAWVEGRNGFGSGERIHFELSEKNAHPGFLDISMTHLYLVNGFRKSEKTYYENNRVKTLRLYVNGKTVGDITLPDRPYSPVTDRNLAYEGDLLNVMLGDLYTDEYNKKRNAFHGVESFDIEILDVYPGTKYDDTCISEIVVLNVPQPSI